MTDLEFTDEQQEKFDDIKRKVNRSEKDLRKFIQGYLKLNETDDIGAALQRAENMMIPKSRQGNETFIVSFVGQEQARDWAKQPKETIQTLANIKETGQQEFVDEVADMVGPNDEIKFGGETFVVSEKEYYNSAGQLLDIRAKRGQRENWTEGEPITSEWGRTVYGVFYKTDDDGEPVGEPKRFEANLSGESAENGIDWTLIAKPLEIYGSVGEGRTFDNRIYIDDSTILDEDLIRDDLEIDIEELIADTFGDRITDIETIEDITEEYGDYALSVTQGVVTDVEAARGNGFAQFYMDDGQSDQPGKVVIGNDQPMNFGVGDTLIVIGQGQWKDNTDDEYDHAYDKEVEIWARGIIPVDRITGDASSDVAAEEKEAQEDPVEQVVSDDWDEE